MRTPVAHLLAFSVSLAVHGAILVAFVVGLVTMEEGFRDQRLAALAVGCLFLVVAVGFVVRRRWADRWNLPIALGLIAAALSTTGAFLSLSWVLSYPVMKPPAFLDWLSWSLSREKNAGLWVAGPVVMTCLASALGYALGGMRSAKVADATQHNSGAV